MRILSVLAWRKVTQQQGKPQIYLRRHFHPDAMPVSRGHLCRFSTAVLQGIKGADQVTGRRHDLQAVMQNKFILYPYFRPALALFTAELPDELLAL